MLRMVDIENIRKSTLLKGGPSEKSAINFASPVKLSNQ